MTGHGTISVVVPVYNSQAYLRDCLDSILAQTYSDLEVICVNDGSTDDSLSILEEYRQREPRVCVITQPNGGASAARNAGIDRAAGEYITFVDSDDALAEDMYETLVSVIEREQADIAHCGYRRHDRDGSVKDVTGTGACIVQNRETAVRCLIDGRLFVGSLCNKLYRRSLFESIRLDTDLKINEDELANVKLFLKAEKSVFYDVPKYLYYDRAGSATSRTKRLTVARDRIKAAERICDLARGTDLYPSATKRLCLALLSEYRACLLYDKSVSSEEFKQKRKRIAAAAEGNNALTGKRKLNYFLLRRLPFLYKYAYPIYNRIRKPNWDV